jgi:cobalt-zinc-cadmium efflux system protein
VGHGHSHAAAGTDERRLAVALTLVLGLMAGEVVVGILARSLALLSDAAHMLTDAAALGLSLAALRLMRRPAGGAWTFGLQRAEPLAALANGGTLLVLGAVIVYEAVRRLVSPPPVAGTAVVVTALVGIAVNLVATWQLARADRENLAVEGSFQHLLTDLYAFAATAVAGLVIVLTGFVRADAIASILVAASMIRAALGLLKVSGRVLLEGAPTGVDVGEIGRALASHSRVVDVHDLHVWEVATGFPSLSAHVLVREGDDCHAVRRDLEAMLHERFAIDHTTLQVDHARRRLLAIGKRGSTTQASRAARHLR